MNWHNMKTSQVKDALNVKAGGLSTKDIELRILTDGDSTFEEKRKKTVFIKIIEQLKSVVNIFTVLSFLLSAVSVIIKDGKDLYEPIVIFALLIFNLVLGIIIDNNAEKVKKEQQSQEIFAKVLRGGVTISVKSDNLVSGDIIFVEAGDIVPADARLLESSNLKCEESGIIGRTDNTEKDADAVVDKEAPLGERVNMIYAGSTVTYGSGTAVVTETGSNTESEKVLSENIPDSRYESPVLTLIKRVKSYIIISEALICLVIIAMGLIKNLSATDFLTLSSTALLAAVPEGIFILIAIISDFGKDIDKLLTMEKLGHITVICTEKSGVLTRSKITAQEVWTKGEPQKLSEEWSDETRQLMEYAVLCSDYTYETLNGDDPVENAILKAVIKNGIDVKKLLENFPRVHKLPFDSDRKLMTTVHSAGGKYFAVVKGAPESIISRCSQIDKKNMLLYSSRMAQNAMKVIAVAVRELDSDYELMPMNEIEGSLNLMGIIGMASATRNDTVKAVKSCKKAGIKTLMVTGDHLEAATAVATEVGICSGSEQVISGVALSKLKPAQFEHSANKFTVFARVSPTDKLKIVQSLQKSGETVAMTGRGINDIPAIRCADIGCVMGNNCAVLAKNAADIVFDEGNFSTVVNTVKQGRVINLNIRKMFSFLISCTVSELLALIILTAFSLGSLSAVSILALNVLIAVFSVLSIWCDTSQKRIMREKPRKYGQKIHKDKYFVTGIVRGLLIGVLAVLMCIIFNGGEGYTNILIFAVLSISFILNVILLKGKKNIIKTALRKKHKDE